MTYEAVNKYELAERYRVNKKTFLRYIRMLLKADEHAPFTMDQYIKLKKIPPKWVEWIESKLG